MRRSLRILEACERLRARRNPGTAIAASNAMIATTIMISTSVKPACFRCNLVNIIFYCVGLVFVCVWVAIARLLPATISQLIPCRSLRGEWQANESSDLITDRRATKNRCRRRPTVRCSRPKGPAEWCQRFAHHRRGQGCCSRRSEERRVGRDNWSSLGPQLCCRWYDWSQLRTDRQQRRSYADG